jgi:hypothetical protein
VQFFDCDTGTFGVAQTSSLLYRGLSACRAQDEFPRPKASLTCRLQVGDIADWKSALRAPVRIEISRPMESASPGAALADVLHQGWCVIINGTA